MKSTLLRNCPLTIVSIVFDGMAMLVAFVGIETVKYVCAWTLASSGIRKRRGSRCDFIF